MPVKRIVLELENKQYWFTEHYRKQLYSYDEMMTPEGDLRPHWKTYCDAIDQLGPESMTQWQDDVKNILQEQGVSYTVYDKTLNQNEWNLDVVPFILPVSDWHKIQEGLKQRAQLLNYILRDIYGDQTLIKKGLIPAELVYTHSGFLRSCERLFLQGDQQLITYAADLARGPDGRMWILNDRTNAPSGAGYALENRSAMLRATPDEVIPIHIRKLSGYFKDIRSNLAGLSYDTPENPRIVVLTPGHGNETYFEHAYLASYLGVTLAQGYDLMVKDHKVWLKTLDGLERVDVIIRRVDDTFCDPLELRQDSYLGVAGLLEAVRQNGVVVVNPLGSSVLENPGLIPFLPGIAKEVLGEKLLLPSAATWWCGQPKELAYVLENISKLLIKCIDRSISMHTISTDTLSQKELEALKERIKKDPQLYIGQQRVSFSTAPAFVNGKIEPRYSVLRAFLFAKGNDYRVMQGGLSRCAPSKNSMFVSNQLGGYSKDTWIVEDNTEEALDIKNPSLQAKPFIRTRGSLSSRTAENMFWSGRYLERALSMARLLRVVLNKFNEHNQSPRRVVEAEELKVLLSTLSQFSNVYPGFVGEKGAGNLKNPEKELLKLIGDPNTMGSLVATLNNLKNALYSEFDQWSRDIWRLLDQIEQSWFRQVKAERLSIKSILPLIDQLVTGLVAFVGLNAENMIRETGWLLMQIGRRIEHGQLNVVYLRSALTIERDDQVEYALLEDTLIFLEGANTYRQRYRSGIQLIPSLELLLLDLHNPKSLTYQLHKLQEYLVMLPNPLSGGMLKPEQKYVLEIYSELRLLDLEALASVDEGTVFRSKLDAFLARVYDKLADTSLQIVQNYFSHTKPQKLFSTTYEPEL